MRKQNNMPQQSQWHVPAAEPDNGPVWAKLWACPSEQVSNVWIPTNMPQVLAGNLEPAKPSIAPRTDGICLLYQGLTHAFNGESESGKSFIAQAICTQLISQHEPVLYLDFESDALTLASRLKQMDATNEDIVNYFAYVAPQTPHTNRGKNGQIMAGNQALALEVFELLLAVKWRLVVIDGVDAALTTYGMDANSANDVWAWAQELPKKLADKTGAAILMIDHVVKNKELRGRYAGGSNAKLNAITGATYLIEPITRIGRGLNGDIKITLVKDRPGGLRRYCQEEGKDYYRAATVNVDSTRADKPTIITFNPPPDPSQKLRPTTLMEQCSKYIEQENKKGRNPSQSAIAARIQKRKQFTQQVIDTLAEEGFIEVIKRNRGYLHKSIRPYRQRDDPKSDKYRPQGELIEKPEPKN